MGTLPIANLLWYEMKIKSRFVVVLVALVSVGWLADHCMLAREFKLTVLRGQLSSRPNGVIEKQFAALPLAELKKNRLSQSKAEFVIVYQVLFCWEMWKQGGQQRDEFLCYASTALRMAEIESSEEFRSRHFLVSKHAILQIDKDQSNFDSFIDLALEL
jgi:hypothetical protein